jgi:sigma-B regulation protein RsbU (phosphoserine phosphatase)
VIQWLGRTAWFQRLALVLVAALSVLAVFFRTRGNSISGLVILAFLLIGLAFRRQLLWRVRNRLLLSYFLFGVVPIVLISALIILTLELGLGQLTADRVKRALDARIGEVQAAAQDIDQTPPIVSSFLRKRLFARMPRLGVVIEVNGDTLVDPPDGPFRTSPAWVEPGFQGLIQVGDSVYIAAKRSAVFTFLPLTLEELDTLTGEAIDVAGIGMGDDDVNVQTDPSGRGVTITSKGVKRVVQSRLRPPRGFWDIVVVGGLPWKAPSEAKRKNQVFLAAFTRPSLLLQGLMSGSVGYGIRAIFFRIASVLLVVELISLVWSLSLTRTITRSAHGLYLGTERVSQGEFTKPIPVQGKHQLSDLAASFNGMTTQIVRLLGEERKKEKLESELEVARQVQNRLFPRTVPQLKTLELAGLCIPGRYVSGDYYDFVPLDTRWTAIALGDVSGKGISAALLMASIQSALHAQLKFRGEAVNPVLSTAALMGLLSQQLYENTPAEKYATFFCSVYDDETGGLTYTNAGHLKPILVRAGKATGLEGDGMVAGLFPHVTYEQQEIQLERGDLLAVFSDGVPEAENGEGKEYGEDRLADLLAENASKPLEEIIRIVTKSVDNWAADPETRDDTTIVLARRV